MRALLIGNLTLDKFGERFKVGGSGYYGGRALASYLGVETYVLTHVDENYRGLVLGTLNSYGVKVLEIRSTGMPVFIISGGKAVQFQGTSHKISRDTIESYIKNDRFDMVVFAPIMREIDEETVRIFEDTRRYTNTVVSLDIQGFVRKMVDSRVVCEWRRELEFMLPYIDIVHGNITEFCFIEKEQEVIKRAKEFSTLSPAAFLVTLDARGTYLVYSGEVFYIPPLYVSTVDDVGAGDILLAVSSYYRARNEDMLSSAIKGVVAASLKVENAYRDWFDRESVESMARIHEKNVKAVSL